MINKKIAPLFFSKAAQNFKINDIINEKIAFYGNK